MGIISSMFDGYKSAKKADIKMKQYQAIADMHMLHSSKYLNDMYKAADNKEQEDCIIEHLIHHYDVINDVDSYMDLHDKIIDKRR